MLARKIRERISTVAASPCLLCAISHRPRCPICIADRESADAGDADDGKGKEDNDCRLILVESEKWMISIPPNNRHSRINLIIEILLHPQLGHRQFGEEGYTQRSSS